MLQNGIKSEGIVSYDEIKRHLYTPLPECNIVGKMKERNSRPEEAKDVTFKQNTQSKIELTEKILRDLYKLFGGLIPL